MASFRALAAHARRNLSNDTLPLQPKLLELNRDPQLARKAGSDVHVGS